MTQTDWRDSLQAFFSTRAEEIGGTPSLEDLCYIAGRDPRLWSDPAMYGDLIASIAAAAGAHPRARLIEVGCASGFLARGIAPAVESYVGVDVSEGALAVARRLELPNASFKHADGERLPFADNSFDAAFCYDVFTNFPRFADGAGVIREMLRVVRPGGRVLAGSIPDAAQQAAYEQRAKDVAAELTDRFGPAPSRVPAKPNLLHRLRRRVRPHVDPLIVCYYFERSEFATLARELGVSVRIERIHPLNPYAEYRFNAIYTKPE